MLAAGLLLGIGLGGFVDGIVLHQILQGHHLLSSEGAARLATWPGLRRTPLPTACPCPRVAGRVCRPLAAVAGGPSSPGALRGPTAGRPDARRLGLFNLVEGLVDHQLLGIHHVKLDADGDPVVALDVAFLAFGALLLVVGSALARSLDVYPVRGRASG
jgi:hypothetical protein